MEKKRKIKDGHIVVENPLFQELPKHEVTLKSGRTLYRFTGSYDGERSKQSYKSKKTCYNLEEKWLVFENTH